MCDTWQGNPALHLSIKYHLPQPFHAQMRTDESLSMEERREKMKRGRNTVKSTSSLEIPFRKLLLLIASFIPTVSDFHLEVFGAISYAGLLPEFRTVCENAKRTELGAGHWHVLRGKHYEAEKRFR